MDYSNLVKGRISIVVPVYNAENELARCVDSILDQTYQNFEVILVDDGSKDGSLDICQKYSEKDSRIKTFHKENGGVGKARNFGLEKISGEWFAFVDADDWLEKDCLEVLYNNALENNCLVSGSAYSTDSEYRIGRADTNEKLLVLDSEQECIRNFICPGLSLNGMVWGKIYSTKAFGNVQFDTTLKINEDCLYSFHVFQICDRACVTSEKLYHWYMREDSACHARPQKIDFSASNVFLELLEKTDALNDDRIKKSLWKQYVTYVSHILFFVKYDKRDPIVKEAYDRLKEQRKYVWNSLDKKQKIKLICVVKYPFTLPLLRKIL